MRTAPEFLVDQGEAATIPPYMRAGLNLLLKACDYAETLQLSAWEFAVEMDQLQATGLTVNDLRWLISKGYLEHGIERKAPDKNHRVFQRTGNLSFHGTTCFILAPRSIAQARLLCTEKESREHKANELRSAAGNGALRPCWDTDRREFRLGRWLIKHFRQPALSQELILAAFEEEGWPYLIFDPLPPQLEQDTKRRLHNTINNLNRNQKRPWVHFRANGLGTGVCWELAPVAGSTLELCQAATDAGK